MLTQECPQANSGKNKKLLRNGSKSWGGMSQSEFGLFFHSKHSNPKVAREKRRREGLGMASRNPREKLKDCCSGARRLKIAASGAIGDARPSRKSVQERD